MKIAFFSDIHANLSSLEAVLADIDQQNPDFVYCLGDLIGYNVWPNEVVETIRKRGIPTLVGNYDEGIGLNSDDCDCAYKTNEEKANGAISISFTNEIVDDSTREYLRMLPRHLSMEFQNNEEVINLLMVQGSPRKINEYLFEDRPDKSLAGYMRRMPEQISCFLAIRISLITGSLNMKVRVKKAAVAVEHSTLPNAYAEALRKGI